MTVYRSGSVPLPPSQVPEQTLLLMLQLPTQSTGQGVLLMQAVSRRVSPWAAEQLAPPYAACKAPGDSAKLSNRLWLLLKSQLQEAQCCFLL